MNGPSWGSNLCAVPCASFRAPRFSAAYVCPILVNLFQRCHRYATIKVGLSTANSSRCSRDLAPSSKTHSSSGHYSYSHLSKRQKLVIAPVKLKRMVPARWMIPNDANISEASALIAITAPELTQPQPCGRRTKENAGVQRPRPVWEENFKTSVLFIATAMYRPYGLIALPGSPRTSVIRRQEKRRRTRSECRQALAP